VFLFLVVKKKYEIGLGVKINRTDNKQKSPFLIIPNSLQTKIPFYTPNIGWEGGKAIKPSKNSFLAEDESDKVTGDVAPALSLAQGFINPRHGSEPNRIDFDLNSTRFARIYADSICTGRIRCQFDQFKSNLSS
jgi:hypothetical protein